MREMLNSELKDKESEDSLHQLADKLFGSVAEFVKISKTEEELRIGFEKLLDPILKSLGIESVPKYERLDAEAKKIYRGRPDAVHGQMIIEYEAPNAFASKSAVHHAYEQLVDKYLSDEKHKAYIV